MMLKVSVDNLQWRFAAVARLHSTVHNDSVRHGVGGARQQHRRVVASGLRCRSRVMRCDVAVLRLICFKANWRWFLHASAAS